MADRARNQMPADSPDEDPLAEEQNPPAPSGTSGGTTANDVTEGQNVGPSGPNVNPEGGAPPAMSPVSEADLRPGGVMEEVGSRDVASEGDPNRTRVESQPALRQADTINETPTMTQQPTKTIEESTVRRWANEWFQQNGKIIMPSEEQRMVELFNEGLAKETTEGRFATADNLDNIRIQVEEYAHQVWYQNGL